MRRLSSLELETLRRCGRPESADTPTEELEQLIEQSLSELPVAAAEDFMKTLGSFGKGLGPTLQRAAPGIVQGASKGAAVGGPWGAVIGAGAGLASSALRKPKGLQPATPHATLPTTIPEVPPLPAGQGAAATLLSLLQNPTVQHALLSQVLGSTGGEQVRAASGQNLPRAAINNLLMQLLANAAEGLPEAESISEQSYLLGESGEYLVDPASPEQQSALVLAHIQAAGLPRSRSNTDWTNEVEWMSEDSGDSESEDWPESEEGVETVEFY